MDSVLITGGTGTFGHAFVLRLLDDKLCERICIYSRGEHTQAAMRAAFLDDKRLRFFIGDVRDQARLRRAMEGCDVVVHAAALKRIEVGHYAPTELVKTNVLGAMNVIEAAHEAHVERVVALSSDKAWAPRSGYGHSKALAESMFIASNLMFAGIPSFAVVRYGNVWCSQGSVLPKWIEQARKERKITVTNMDCTRFFMFKHEAVDIVLEAIRGSRDLYVPQSLPAYRLGDLAIVVSRLLHCEIEVTSLPSWEKMHEGLCDGVTSDVAPRMSVEMLYDLVSKEIK